ncbi:MAG: RDD family protein [Undibacterium sp.]|nr:RDD family protein [Undibacterium sp.]
MSTEINPYQTPVATLDQVQYQEEAKLAGKGRRFGTLIVDYLGFIFLAFCVGLFVGGVFGEAGLRKMQSVPDMLIGLVLMTAYYVFFEGIWGRTPGKWVFGTKVLNESGHQASFGQIVGRTFARYIPFEAFSCLFGERGWHDKLSETKVVLTRNSP